jgi:hypothetical protein
VEIVRALFERWNEGNHGVEAVPDFFDPAIELESPFSSVMGEPYRGYAGIERWISDLDEQFSVWSLGPHEVREVGSQVLTIGPVEARGRASDITLQFPAAGVFDFASDHRVIHVRIYTDASEARKAVGLEG